jgi:hypothetical protein
MYFHMDTPHVRLVCIDIGIKGHIDDEQEAWLRRVSADPKPKILISGKPIYANGEYDDNLANVDQIVKEHNYCLVIAGDTHNFQKYRVPVETNGRRRYVWHLVNGGGGAFLVRTHTIPLVSKMTRLPVRLQREPEDFECYPTRQQSHKDYSWWKERMPDWLVDHDRPPYHKSFVKVRAEASGLRVRVFEVDDFYDKPNNDLLQPEWVIPYV